MYSVFWQFWKELIYTGPSEHKYINSPIENSVYPKERIILQKEKPPAPKECLLIYVKSRVIDVSIKTELQILKTHLLLCPHSFCYRQTSILNNQKVYTSNSIHNTILFLFLSVLRTSSPSIPHSLLFNLQHSLHLFFMPTIQRLRQLIMKTFQLLKQPGRNV